MRAFTIAKKDLLIEFRTKHTINFMLLFAFISILIFSYIVGVFVTAIPQVGPGLLWLVFIFTGMLGLARAFIREKELETLDGIKLTPIGGGDILLGKILYNLVLMLLVQSLAFPMFILFFNFPVKGSVFVAFLFLTMGNIGFVVVGSAISVLVMNAKARELLLPVILFPILFPIIVSSILALQKVLVEGATIQSTAAEIKLIVAYTIMMGVIAFLTFDYALEE